MPLSETQALQFRVQVSPFKISKTINAHRLSDLKCMQKSISEQSRGNVRGVDRWPLTERDMSALQNREAKRVRKLMCSAES